MKGTKWCIHVVEGAQLGQNGGTGQGGAPRRAAAKRSTPIGAVSCVAPYNEGQVRACDMLATCLHSVLRSVQQGVEG